MKNIYKLILVTLLIGTSFSCTESDLIIDQVLEDVDSESGAVLRTIERPRDLVTLTGENNLVTFTIEVQEGNGSFQPDFKEVRAYVGLFQDQDLINPLVDDNGNDLGEALFATLAASDFSIGSNGLPRIAAEIPTQAIVDAYPANTVYTIPSFISLRLELEMTDGRIFTNTNLGASVSGGTYFGSSFLYKIIFLPN